VNASVPWKLFVWWLEFDAQASDVFVSLVIAMRPPNCSVLFRT
jgi:hypothetical protein